MLNGYGARHYYKKDETELSIEIGLFENHKFQLMKDFITSYDPDDVLENQLVDVDKYIDDINHSYIEKINQRTQQEAEKRSK